MYPNQGVDLKIHFDIGERILEKSPWTLGNYTFRGIRGVTTQEKLLRISEESRVNVGSF